MNLGTDLELSPIPEPLLAPPADAGGGALVQRGDRYGGRGEPALATDDGWHAAGRIRAGAGTGEETAHDRVDRIGLPMLAPPERIGWRAGDDPPVLTREWMVTNGLGGYASGTLAGVPTRRIHGLLIAALPAPLGRTLMLNHLVEELRLDDGSTLRRREPQAADSRTCAFRLGPPAAGATQGDGVALEKSILMPHRQNTTLCQLSRCCRDRRRWC